MRILPILFNTEMVRGILEKRKSATRRVIKYIASDVYKSACFHGRWHEGMDVDNLPRSLIDWYCTEVKRPPCAPGDILYVRETWTKLLGSYIYKANQRPGMKNPGKWSPSIHMPKEAARIFLRVTDVRVERLQEITEDGAIADGVKPSGGNFALDDFEPLWDSTIKPADRDKYGWYANPWVWVIEFERTDKPEGWPGAI